MEKKSVTVERELVLSMLMEIYKEKEYSHILLRQVLDKYGYLSGNKKAFIKRLTEGTLERTMELDYVINQFSKVTTNKMKPFIRVLLRMSVYQILYMDQVPDRAVCDEAVRLAALHKFSSLKGFVNGVLRNIARQKGEISYPEKEDDILQYLTIKYSMPLWIAEHFVDSYGEEKAEIICQGFLEERGVTIRLKEDISSEKREELFEKWRERAVRVTPHPCLSYAFLLEKTEGITTLEGFCEGLFTVQDVSSMLVSEVAGIREGMKIVDVCAAPGGKATHAALKLKNTGKVIARDVSQYKVGLMEESIRRQQLENTEVQVWDARCFDENLKGQADIVLCDVPCSGLGVMGKKPDIKYRIKKEALSDLIRLQQDIIAAAIGYVKEGGIFLYSTCTINKEENERQAAWILEHFPMEQVSLKEGLPPVLQEEEGEYGLQLLPAIHRTDGFFLAKFRRKNGY